MASAATHPPRQGGGTDKSLKLDREATFFVVAGPLGKDDSIVAENMAITERRADKPTKVPNRLGARTVADFKEQAPVSTLDIVPANPAGKRDFKTDEQGAFETPLPWRGGYVIEVAHTDATPGELGGEAYDSARSASTPFVRVGDRMQDPPQPPVTTPKR